MRILGSFRIPRTVIKCTFDDGDGDGGNDDDDGDDDDDDIIAVVLVFSDWKLWASVGVDSCFNTHLFFWILSMQLVLDLAVLILCRNCFQLMFFKCCQLFF